MTEQPDNATGVFVEEALEDDVVTHAHPGSRSHGESSMDVSSRRWLRDVAVVAVVVIVVAVAVVIYGAVRHRDNQETDARTAASVAAARDWVNLFVTANDDTVVARADEITARTGDPLHADAMNRIEPYLEQLFDDGSDIRCTSRQPQQSKTASRPADHPVRRAPPRCW